MELFDIQTWRADEESALDAAMQWHYNRVAALRMRDDIVDGKHFPAVPDLIHGQPPFKDSLRLDVERFTTTLRQSAGAPESLREDLSDFRSFSTAAGAERLHAALGALVGSEDDDSVPSASFGTAQSRAAWYGAILGSRRLSDWLFARYRGDGHDLLVYRNGIERVHPLRSADDWRANYQEEIVAMGELALLRLADNVDFRRAMRDHAALVIAWREGNAHRETVLDALGLTSAPAEKATPVEAPVPADDAEVEQLLAVDELERFMTRKIRVLRKLNDTGTADQKGFAKLFKPLHEAGARLVEARDVAAIAWDLATDWPHAENVVHRILADIREGQPVRIRPTLLVGEPGSGKTRLLRELAERLGLRQVVYPCASVADGSFGGTPAQWSTRRVSTPLELIRTSETANPCIILDEIEKTGRSDHNGSLMAALLPMLERHSSEAYFETALEVDANLSAVNFLATANSLAGLPDPLRDRFRVIRMPSPTIEHVSALAPRMLVEISAERNLPLTFVDELAPDELGVIRRAWGGGSLRKLKAAIETTLDLRDRVATYQ